MFVSIDGCNRPGVKLTFRVTFNIFIYRVLNPKQNPNPNPDTKYT